MKNENGKRKRLGVLNIKKNIKNAVAFLLFQPHDNSIAVSS